MLLAVSGLKWRGLEAGAAAASEYRTLPMVWYVRLCRDSVAADAGELGSNDILPDVDGLRIPVRYWRTC